MLRLGKMKTRRQRPELPDDVELLSYLDGQLSSERCAEIEKLLADSWELRLRLSELSCDIEAYTEATSHLVPPEVPPFEQVWKGAPANVVAAPMKMKVLPGHLRKPQSPRWFFVPHWLRWPESIAFPSPKLAGALALLAIVVIGIWIRMGTAPTVSAQELLKRTISAEELTLSKVSKPVIYQKLQVRRRSVLPTRNELASWEIWNDSTRNRCRQRGGNDSNAQESINEGSLEYPQVLSELQAVYRTNRMNQHRPLSPAAFASWQALYLDRKDKVSQRNLPDGREAFVLTTEISGSAAPNKILQGELVVRANDWHPVEQHLKVQGSDGIEEYQVTESDFQVLALNTLGSTFFAETPLPFVPAAAATAPAVSSVVMPTSAELLAAEIQAFYGIHRAKACLGESIEVVRTPKGRIDIRGLAASAEQKEELLDELQRVPYVDLSIQTIEEAVNSGESRSRAFSQAQAASESVAKPNIIVPPAHVPIQKELEKYFSKTEIGSVENQNVNLKIAELSTEALSFARETLSNAWALQRLAERLSSVKIDQLPLQSKWLLETMIRDHLSDVQSGCARSRRLLSPIIASILTGDGSSAAHPTFDSSEQSKREGSSWIAQVHFLFERIQKMDRLTNGLLAGVELPVGGENRAAQELISLFEDLSRSFPNLEQEIVQEFSGHPTRMESKK